MAQMIPLAAAAVGGLLGGKLINKALNKKTEDAPAPAAAPAVMPTPDDQAIMRARRQSIIQQRARRGRESTLLTSASDKLGG